jgi:hypothetical protein
LGGVIVGACARPCVMIGAGQCSECWAAYPHRPCLYVRPFRSFVTLCCLCRSTVHHSSPLSRSTDDIGPGCIRQHPRGGVSIVSSANGHNDAHGGDDDDGNTDVHSNDTNSAAPADSGAAAAASSSPSSATTTSAPATALGLASGSHARPLCGAVHRAMGPLV